MILCTVERLVAKIKLCKNKVSITHISSKNCFYVQNIMIDTAINFVTILAFHLAPINSGGVFVEATSWLSHLYLD